MAATSCFLCVLVFVVVFSFLLAEDELKILDDNSFEHLTQAATGATTGDWLIVFTNNHDDCSQCKNVEDILIKLSAKFQHKLNTAKVLPSSKLTIKRFEVTKWPAVSLFHHGHQYYYTNDQYSEESMTAFVEDYKKHPNRKVPEPVTMFDVIVEKIMDDVKFFQHGDWTSIANEEYKAFYLVLANSWFSRYVIEQKHIIRVRKNAAFVIFFSGILFGLMLMPILKCVADFLVATFTNDQDKKEDEDEREDEEGEEEKEEEKNTRQKKEN